MILNELRKDSTKFEMHKDFEWTKNSLNFWTTVVALYELQIRSQLNQRDWNTEPTQKKRRVD